MIRVVDNFRVSFGYNTYNMPTLTPRQKQVLDFVKSYRKKRDYSPSLEEIAVHLGVSSVATVHEHLANLITKGLVQREENQKRAIELNTSEPMVHVPLLGTIAAGRPIEAIQEKENIALPANRLPKSGNIFALKVIGDSMINEGINNGDVILVREQRTASNGQKVVALIDNSEATVKKFYKERGRIRLEPANKDFEPIIVTKEDGNFQIQGLVIDVVRTNDIITPIQSPSNQFESKPHIGKHLNKTYLGDVMDLLVQLPDNSVDMVFGDPDYNVGIKYGDKSYTKNFNEYIDWYTALTKEAIRVLRKDGNLFMMNYPKQNAHLRVKFLDAAYPYISEYVWVYNTNVGHTPKRFTTAHRTILHVRKSEENKFYKDNVALPYKNLGDRRIKQNLKNGSAGRMPYSWFYFNLVKNVSKEKTYHACQIPQKLTEMLVKSCTIPGNTVLILFGGSGSEIEVCKQLKRNFVSAEIDKKYHALITSRLENGHIKEEHRLKFKNRQVKRENVTIPLLV